MPPLVEPASELSIDEVRRSSRHLIIPDVAMDGQKRLKNAKVLAVGAGGLGSPTLMYLAAAGVGTLGIVDADVVDASNLQRQILHATSRIGEPKVSSAQKTIAEINPDVKVIPHEERMTSENVERLFSAYDLVVDGTDNFPTRYLVNDASVFLGKPVVHGSIFRFDGQVTTFVPKKAAQKFGVPEGPCYRCLYPEPPPPHLAPSCQEAGVLGILCGIIGTIQATEAIKLILGKGDVLSGRLLAYDSLKMRFHELRLRKDTSCPVCSTSPRITSYVDYEGFCAIGS